MGLLSGFFGWRPGEGANSPTPPPGFDAIWQPGEIAECIVAGTWVNALARTVSSGPDIGERHRVAGVKSVWHPHYGVSITLLSFSVYQGWFTCIEFRKVVPQHDAAEAADRAFLEQLRPARASETAGRDA